MSDIENIDDLCDAVKSFYFDEVDALQNIILDLKEQIKALEDENSLLLSEVIYLDDLSYGLMDDLAKKD